MRCRRIERMDAIGFAACLALAGCAEGPSATAGAGGERAPRAQRPGCTVELAADVPYTVEQGSLLVPGAIAGIEARLEVHTFMPGGALTMNRWATANRRFGIAPPATVARTGGAPAQDDWIQTGVAEVRVGDAVMSRVVADIPTDPSWFRNDLPGDGILGIAFLSNFDVEIVPRLRRLRLYRVAGCGDTVAPPFAPFEAVALRLLPDGRPLVPLVVNGARLEAGLNSGVNTTYLGLPGAEAAGKSRAEVVAARQKIESTNFFGVKSALSVLNFRSVVFAGRDYGSVDLVVDPEFRADAIIGLDVILDRRMLISFSTGRLFVATDE